MFAWLHTRVDSESETVTVDLQEVKLRGGNLEVSDTSA